MKNKVLFDFKRFIFVLQNFKLQSGIKQGTNICDISIKINYVESNATANVAEWILPLTCLHFSELRSPNDKVQRNCFLKLLPGQRFIYYSCITVQHCAHIQLLLSSFPSVPFFPYAFLDSLMGFQRRQIHCSSRTEFTCYFIDEQFKSLVGCHWVSITILARTWHEFTHD